MPNVVGGSVVWNLDVDESKLKAGLADAQKDVAKTASNVQGNFDDTGKKFATLGTSIVGVAATAGTAFIAAGTAAVGFALKSAADVQMLRTNFDTLLGSADKGRALFTQLQQMANVTPFTTVDLANASQRLLAMGVNVKDLLPDLQRLGDVSLGNRDKFDSLALVFGQISSKGKLMGDDLRQLNDVGFNPLQKISERTGESMESLNKKMSDGQISFQMVSDEFARATAEGGQFFGGMEKGSKTVTGMFSTLQDTIGIAARSMVGLSAAGDIVQGGLFDKLSTGLKQLIDYLTANQEQITKFGTTLVNNAVMAVTAFVGALKITWDWIQKNKTVVEAVVISLAAFAAAAVIAAGVAFVVANAMTIAIGVAFVEVGLIITKIIQDFKRSKDETIKVWNAISSFFTDLWANIRKSSADAWTAITKGFTDALNGIHDFFVNSWNSTVSFFQTALNAIIFAAGFAWGALVSGVKNAIAAYINYWMTLPANVAFAIGSVIGFMVKFATVDLPNFINTVATWFEQLPGRISTAANNMWTAFSTAVTNLWNDAVTKTTNGFNAVVSWFDALPGRIQTGVTNGWNSFSTWWNNAWNTTKQNAIDTGNSVVDWFTSLGPKIAKAAGDLWGSTKSSFINFGNAIKDWGSGLIDSIVSFFTSLPQKIKDAVTGAAKNAGDLFNTLGTAFTNGIKHGLGIPGFANGVTNFSGGIARVGEQGPETVILPPGSSVIPHGQNVGGGVNITTTIYPQSDLDLEAFSRSIAFEAAGMS